MSEEKTVEQTQEERVALLEKKVGELTDLYASISQIINRLHPQKPVGVPKKSTSLCFCDDLKSRKLPLRGFAFDSCGG